MLCKTVIHKFQCRACGAAAASKLRPGQQRNRPRSQAKGEGVPHPLPEVAESEQAGQVRDVNVDSVPSTDAHLWRILRQEPRLDRA